MQDGRQIVLQIMAMNYLLKTEPTVYSFEQLIHDREVPSPFDQ